MMNDKIEVILKRRIDPEIIPSIKQLRAATGLGLKEAKEMVDFLNPNEPTRIRIFVNELDKLRRHFDLVVIDSFQVACEQNAETSVLEALIDITNVYASRMKAHKNTRDRQRILSKLRSISGVLEDELLDEEASRA